jgi:hypothetical protein
MKLLVYDYGFRIFFDPLFIRPTSAFAFEALGKAVLIFLTEITATNP